MYNIEVCFTPALLELFEIKNKSVVIIDILRASTSICAAFKNGAFSILPVGNSEDAKKLKKEGWFLAAERNGIVLDFADTGNSPHYFSQDNIKGKSIAYSTTNGTKAIKMAEGARNIFIGSFINLDAVANKLSTLNNDVLVFCSGWKKHFNIEDSLFAGALSKKMLESKNYTTNCDSTLASIDLWDIAKDNLKEYAKKIAWNKRLNMPEVFDYCFNLNLTGVVPYFDGNLIKGDL